MKKKLIVAAALALVVVILVVVLVACQAAQQEQQEPQNLGAQQTVPVTAEPAETQSPEPTVEPTPEPTPDPMDIVQSYGCTLEELQKYFPDAYTYGWSEEALHMDESERLKLEFEYLRLGMERDSLIFNGDAKDAYLDWRSGAHPTHTLLYVFEDYRCTMFASTNLNVYSDPDTASSVLGTISKRGTVSIISINEEGIWVEVESGFGKGYVDTSKLVEDKADTYTFTACNETVYAIRNHDVYSDIDFDNVAEKMNVGDSATRIGIGGAGISYLSKLQLSDGRIVYCLSSALTTTPPATQPVQPPAQPAQPATGENGGIEIIEDGLHALTGGDGKEDSKQSSSEELSHEEEHKASIDAVSDFLEKQTGQKSDGSGEGSYQTPPEVGELIGIR